MASKCDHCSYIGKLFSIVDSEGKACDLRVNVNKVLQFNPARVCPLCGRIQTHDFKREMKL